VVAAVVEQACSAVNFDPNEVIAIVVTVHDSVEERDTLRAHATTLTAAGDTVTAAMVWSSLDTTLLGVVDSTTGVFLGKQAGLGTIYARSANLRSSGITITITQAADTLFAAGDTRDTIHVGAADSLSDALSVTLADTMINAPPAAPTLVPLANRRVIFAITSAPVSATVSLVPNDVTYTVATTDTVFTDVNGTAVAKIRYLGGGALPDSVRVTATARRAVGTAVPGSPVAFVVRIAP
jgi:hypothetical protein